MNKKEAIDLLHSKVKNLNLRKHCYAVAAVMKSLANHFGEDEELWETVGLLHDADYEETKSDPQKHTILLTEWLKEKGEVSPEILSAILSHNYAHTGQNPPKNNLEWSLYCCDELTGFIVAVTLVRPEKDISKVSVENILSKWNSKSFAAGVKREQIEMCKEKLGIKLSEFVEIALRAMQEIHEDLGL
ncbi:MAG: HDIG domain protein [Microgenomates group bacterium GW2011_GWC1_41_20]|uniref:HDIG domain protein n=7 Tax=Candidatus Woeseibacteriota TaxID=1752722 RepID=A0A0G0U8U5_9BACT|nr:MAG: HDIG domain protein [Candidatus Woesebacteria bacterium GW2011_GWB1_40_12]KKR55905.1 MAG: HDIG domain protein [Candidatus Woesebacteria bacterium GW2011_GWF1_40_24]KKR90886.1 MAG: HDIG domain protein [Candidatus Woesebacteria bacterium GW2011_GWD1_41_12]KKS00510.1 MAG: HDIG domain protein [Microgenomates group bacterium GW2011_GWC1_41_20]KKS05623.1 MAG: HDIG domain protein [Candidatus Woesebacteria bacterium GW2011_GWE1_41_24]KKS17951.1 MAG: HDIG domain protein [Candidatus Woesebacteri